MMQKAGDSKLIRDQIKRTIPLEAKQKTRTQKRQIEETICSTFKQINDL